ncbi:cysteine-rich CWC family protein [Acidiphilium sp. 20-67-58]|uniref:cysteine-rich CWC family protein n=1 Tax=Acidiphilium sp. 20-67-58 TaxID=1970291 RepID=UPI0025C14200|nr:cysteine-rich CWC family protein [Acidiphilium sp. 20-67-58]
MTEQTGYWKFQQEPAIFRSMQSICPRCRAPMICQHDGSCWCTTLPVVMPMPADDAAHCVCPNCLREMQDKIRRTIAAADHDRTEETHGSQTH